MRRRDADHTAGKVSNIYVGALYGKHLPTPALEQHSSSFHVHADRLGGHDKVWRLTQPVGQGPRLCISVSLPGHALGEGTATHSSVHAWRIPMDRGAWQDTVHGVAKSQTQLNNEAQPPPGPGLASQGSAEDHRLTSISRSFSELVPLGIACSETPRGEPKCLC